MVDDTITTIYYLCDECLKAIRHEVFFLARKDRPQRVRASWLVGETEKTQREDRGKGRS